MSADTGAQDSQVFLLAVVQVQFFEQLFWWEKKELFRTIDLEHPSPDLPFHVLGRILCYQTHFTTHHNEVRELN